ncbi:MAG: FecR domain-containing protein [Ginsengibacter sp.]
MDYLSFLPEDFICNESFQHFCNGTVQEDIVFWQNWISNNPQKMEEIEEAIHMVNVLTAKQGNLSAQNLLLKDTFTRREQFKEKLFAAAPVINIHKNNKARKRRYFFPAAAACLVMVIFGAGYYFQNPAHKTDVQLARVSATYSAGLQPRNTILLSDGSLVTLAKNSSIKLVEGFSNNKRELTLSGEAYFDIKHDATSPFLIHTSRMELVVLGTVFNVKDFADSASSEAFLISGRLSVSARQDIKNTFVLKPNEGVVISRKKEKGIMPAKSENPFEVKKMEAAVNNKSLAWIHNRLSIDDEPLFEIARRLQDWYGIQISFADDSVKNYRYSGIFESETVVQALQALQLSYPFKFTSIPQQIIISK